MGQATMMPPYPKRTALHGRKRTQGQGLELHEGKRAGNRETNVALSRLNR